MHKGLVHFDANCRNLLENASAETQGKGRGIYQKGGREGKGFVSKMRRGHYIAITMGGAEYQDGKYKRIIT
jgi:hypothetical protein